MSEQTNDPYRPRLVEYVERWKQSGARVAIYGTGPHTDLLFDRVPELAAVNIVGYVQTTVPKPAPRYRGRRVRPLDWAAAHADVVLCSSFVSEAAMAATAEPLPCKVVTSHALTVKPLASSPGVAPVVYRPNPVGQRVLWPDAGTSDATWNRYAQETRVLDAVLEHFYSFVEPADADLARALVRYIGPGASVVEFNSPSPRMSALIARCGFPRGRLLSVTPQFDAAALRPHLGHLDMRVVAGTQPPTAADQWRHQTVTLVKSAVRPRPVPAATARRARTVMKNLADVCVVHVRPGSTADLQWRRLCPHAPLVLVRLQPGCATGVVASWDIQLREAGYQVLMNARDPFESEGTPLVNDLLLVAHCRERMLEVSARRSARPSQVRAVKPQKAAA